MTMAKREKVSQSKVGLKNRVVLRAVRLRKIFTDPRLKTHVPRYAVKLQNAVIARWKIPLVVFAVLGLYLSIKDIFSATVTLDSLRQQSASWIMIDTTLGLVRSFSEPTGSYPTWLLGWQSDFLYAGLFLLASILLLRLIKPKRQIAAYILVATLFALVGLWQVQRQEIKTRTTFASSQTVSASPLVPRLAYLRQCGDEIPYAFDSQTSGLLFRKLRDEGYTLASTIPTSYGYPDLQMLCGQYDRLRTTYKQGNVVLQLYTQRTDGTIRVYKFSDLASNKSSYGFFVK